VGASLGRTSAAPLAPGPFDDLRLERLRSRRSAKWSRYPPDVLPAWVAEMDFPLAPAIARALRAAVDRDDAGYADAGRLPEVYATFAAARFGWQVDPGRVVLVADVMSGVAELLRALTDPGDGVVVNPPVYPPFFNLTREVGRRVVEAPLARGPAGWELDLDALESAFAAGARAYLLCHPHNPTGRSLAPDELAAVAELAVRHDVLVVSDEIHAPLTLNGARHTPYLTVGSEAAERGIAIVGASKAWNIAGLKCALIVTGSARMEGELAARLPKHVPLHVGHLGVLASIAAFESAGDWLDSLTDQLDRNRRRLAELLAEHLPKVGYVQPQAGYLAWLDCRELDLGDDPAGAFLERGRVALSSGPTFGADGRGFARLNFGTSAPLLEEAVRRMAAAVEQEGR
jgi:cysteine-S-conjugate beta-lyase